MEFRVARAARITGEMLERLVREALKASGTKEPDCVVCYGVGYTGPKPSLNAACHADKMEQGIRLERSLGPEALKILPIANGIHTDFLPVVARKRKHAKGKDMRLCRTPKGLIAMLRNRRHDFVTPVVDSDTEYRCWVYRKRVLAVYEKRLTEPEKNVKFGRNRANGWTFHALTTEQIPDSVRRVSVAAVRALGLDFGAVDVLGKNSPQGVKATVLEVNSAPGVSDEHRTAIVKLVNRIAEWARHGCPARAADEAENAGRLGRGAA